MNGWAIAVPRTSAAALARLRLLSGAEACLVEGHIWLRITRLSKDDQRQLRAVPGALRYERMADNVLRPWGALLPTRRLPDASWQPLREVLALALKTRPGNTSVTPALALTLVREHRERPAAALRTTLREFSAYADRAPLARLTRLHLLANSRGEALLFGSPLPPLPGQRYWESEQIFVAAGYCWQPAVDATVIRRVLRCDALDLILWHADASWQAVSRDQLVLATRSAVRATIEELAHGTS